MTQNSIRRRLESALAGEEVRHPPYIVYDWFVEHRQIDWAYFFRQGLGRLNHADLVDIKRPHLEVVETSKEVDGHVRRDVRWITDQGELHEWYLGEWRQEYLIKSPDDYLILKRALEDSRFTANPEPFQRSEDALGENGMTVGQMWRTPVMEMQIDRAGLERFSMDLAYETPQLMELLELMEELFMRHALEAVKTPARYIKLWENLSIETLGPSHYRRWLAPIYRKMFDIFDKAGKRLLVHYDGKLSLIADDVAELDIDGLDSLTPPPEGDMSVEQARSKWSDKFLWLHPPLGWYREDSNTLRQLIRSMVRHAGPRRFCLMISEDVPPDCRNTVPVVLDELASL